MESRCIREPRSLALSHFLSVKHYLLHYHFNHCRTLWTSWPWRLLGGGRPLCCQQQLVLSDTGWRICAVFFLLLLLLRDTTCAQSSQRKTDSLRAVQLSQASFPLLWCDSVPLNVCLHQNCVFSPWRCTFLKMTRRICAWAVKTLSSLKINKPQTVPASSLWKTVTEDYNNN